MAFLKVKNVAVKGISACVPTNTDRIEDIYRWPGKESFLNTIGIYGRRRANEGVTSSDLCVEAAERLITELGWNKDEIESLIFVSQTPDYLQPATSAIVQNRLGLPETCFAIDISLGCSGWVYAMSVLTALMSSGTIKKGLLLAGDTTTKLISSEDKSVWPLFGDAGTATALEYDSDADPIRYIFNTDGNGAETIMIKDGGARNPFCEESLKYIDYGDDKIRNGMQTGLDGMDVFSFGITKAPKSVKQLCERFEIDMEGIDIFTFHQANMMMNEMIRKKLKIPAEKCPYCMAEFGNTSCASIPLTLVAKERGRLEKEKLRHIACGFGVGLSWGTINFTTNKICVPELIESGN